MSAKRDVRRVTRGVRRRLRARAYARYLARRDTDGRERWEQAEVRTLDVFDTALTRAVGSPQSMFHEVGRGLHERGLLRVPVGDFVRLRADAETSAFTRSGGLDSSVGLRDIHRVLAQEFAAVADPEQTWPVEREVEATTLRPVGVHAAHLRQDGRPPVVFLSDSYHDEDFIIEVLRSNGLMQPDDRAYVSSRHRASKTSGRLFQVLTEGRLLEPSVTAHRGDDPQADWHSARQAGLDTHPFPEGRMNRYEQLLDDGLVRTHGLTGRLAGASRLARLDLPVTGEHETALRDVAAGVAAPLLTGFLLWALRRAVAAGVRRVAFVARDGQVLRDMADQLIDRLGLDLETRYLYGSRQAWLLPTLADASPVAAGWLTQAADVHRMSPRVLLARIGLACEDVAGELDRAGWPAARWDEAISERDRTSVLRILLDDPTVAALTRARAGEQRDLLLEHLRQEGLTDGKAFALVDLATGGTLHGALTTTLRHGGLPEPVSLVLGRRRGSLLPPGAKVETWFPPEDLSSTPELPDGLVPALELFCLADHETVLGYDRADGAVRPVFAPGDGAAARAWGQPLVRRTLTCVAGQVVLHATDLDVDLRTELSALFRCFWHAPTREEALAWGSAPLEDGWGEHSLSVQVAAPFDWSSVVNGARSSSPERDRAVRTWRHGSLRLSSPVLATALRLAYSTRDAARRSRG